MSIPDPKDSSSPNQSAGGSDSEETIGSFQESDDERIVQDMDETMPGVPGGVVPDLALRSALGLETHPGVFVVREMDDESPQEPHRHMHGAPGFTLLRRVGSGGMGEVWEAIQSSLRRRVAIKRLRRDLTLDIHRAKEAEALSRMFFQEALTTANLQHPNIVPVHDLGIDEQGNPLLTMKLVRGVPWADQILADVKLPPAEYFSKHLAILIDVAQAIAYAHSKGIIHRDLKPSQVMIGEFGEVVVMDWGLAVPFKLPADETPESERVGLHSFFGKISCPSGTPSYMAPEQTLTDPDSLGPWTDIFLLGGILYFLLTRTAPYSESDRSQAFQQAKGGDVEPPELRSPAAEIPAKLSSLAMAAMAPQPKDRLPSVRGFIDELNAYLSGADKRRESQQIVQEVEERYQAAPTSYTVLSDCLVALARARGLWLENPQIQKLHNRVVESYANAALKNNDLTLARSLAEQSSSLEDRRILLNMVELAQAKNHRTAKERRLAIGFAFFTILLLVFGGIKYARDQKWAREKAEQAREAATLQRDAAEKEQYFYGIRFADIYLWEGRLNQALAVMLDGVPARLRDWEWGILAARYASDEMVLTKSIPPRDIYHASFSPDGNRIVMGRRAGIISLWDANTGARIVRRDLHNRGIWTATFSPDGTKILAGSTGGMANILDASTLDVLTTITGHISTAPVMRGAAFSPTGDRVISTGNDAFARVWDARNGSPIWAVKMPKATYSAEFSPDGKTVAVSMVGAGQVQLLDATTGSLIRTYEGHTKSVYGVRFSPDGARLASSCTDQKARVFNVATGALLVEISHPKTYPNNLAFSPDGKLLATAAEDGTCRVWDSTSGALVEQLFGGPEMQRVEFSPDGQRIVATSLNEVKVWNIKNMLQPAEAVAREDVPATATLEVIRTTGFPYDRQGSWAYNDEAWVAPEGRNYFKSKNRWVAVDSYYSVYSADNKQRIDIAFNGSKVTAWDNETSQVLAELAPNGGFNAAFSPDGRLAATATQRGELVVWNTKDWKPIGKGMQGADKTALWSLSFSPDAKTIALGWLNGDLSLWDVEGQKIVYNLKAHIPMRPVISVKFSPDGQRILTSSSDTTAKIFDAKTGRLLSTLSGHEKFLVGAEFSKDGKLVLTASSDGKVKLWESTSGREIMTLRSEGPDRTLMGAHFTSDGLGVLAVTSKKTISQIEVFPWELSDYPGGSEMPFEKRLELYKRRVRMNPDIEFADIVWE